MENVGFRVNNTNEDSDIKIIKKYFKTDDKVSLNLKGNESEDLDFSSYVTMQISKEAREKLEEMKSMMYGFDSLNEDDEADESEEMGKVMTIFRRICKGDIVPYQDEKKLMEYDKDLYQMAKMASAMAKNDKPKRYKSVDEENGENTQDGGSISETSSLVNSPSNNSGFEIEVVEK